jgi:hypothetical protein
MIVLVLTSISPSVHQSSRVCLVTWWTFYFHSQCDACMHGAANFWVMDYCGLDSQVAYSHQIFSLLYSMIPSRLGLILHRKCDCSWDSDLWGHFGDSRRNQSTIKSAVLKYLYRKIRTPASLLSPLHETNYCNTATWNDVGDGFGRETKGLSQSWL